ncbi:hypothetical protein MSAN_00286500 [Mycena sanguinolenta]|uniref:CxC1-like cysteine cluster associated with KDZ transposases domain-containing protein n=1 Tax=Mycena sanguinolenta TaxID=230812 RepID=A0A8H6ZBY0_9AGAR|nr:hypothetical protein MSAN_00286500 [Mycena sanguinolenta]
MKKGAARSTANSRKVGVLGSGYDPVNRIRTAPTNQRLSRAGQDRYRKRGADELEARLRNMPEEQLENFRALRDFSGSHSESPAPESREDEDMDPSLIHMRDVLDGSTRLEMSHAGGEFIAALQEGIEEEMSQTAGKKKKSSPDYRVRDDRTQNLVNGWKIQMERLVPAYMTWCAETDLGRPRETTPTMVEEMQITVVDLYETSTTNVELNAGGDGVAAALIKQGLIPCAPWNPSVAISTRVLELYRTTHVRCPQLAIQPFVKSLCDLHGVAYRPYLRDQFSVAYDVYLELRRQTDSLVNSALGRDSPKWRLKHACPACTYKLEGEEELIFSILTTMDGNDSLKRVLRRSKTDGSEDEPTLGPSKEREDSRDGGEDYFLSREQVDRWAKDRVADILPSDSKNPCSNRWKNMIDDVTSRMWGIFDETGIFLALCRHGFVLVVADMVRSGELSKYPLAIVNELLQAFGLKVGGGYDIGCHFDTTLGNSGLGDKARENRFRSLVGSFHGHAHNRLCQLSFLATYVEGLGLEDLEGCERYFSRSNVLAKSVCYASKFHRRQDITTFMKQIDDFETYPNLSKFLCDNYRQALKILKTEPELKRWMAREGLDDYDSFHVWLEEERQYLLGLEDGLPKKKEETVEMEYVRRLMNLQTSQSKLSSILSAEKAAAADRAAFNPTPASQVSRCHAIEKRNRDQELVQDLETRLNISSRWTSASPEWVLAVKAIKDREYQDALDQVEKIIVERLFEMTKINQSGTGYKMHKHIAKALQARSKAIKSAIERYNTVALDMNPPMPMLSWEEVVNYGFLADFDILRDTRDSIRSRPWTRPSYRVAMDNYFKILRAREEIKRLNIEIKRVVTWIDDEDRFLRKKEKQYEESDPALAVQISRYRQRRARSDHTHMLRFWALAKTPGFTGSLVPGRSVERQELRRASRATQQSAAETEIEVESAREASPQSEEMQDVGGWSSRSEEEWEDEEDEGEDAQSEAASNLLYQMSVLSVDRDDDRGSNRLD